MKMIEQRHRTSCRYCTTAVKVSGQLGGASPVGPSGGFGSTGGGSGGAALFSSTGGGGGASFFSFAAKNAANSPRVRKGALPSMAACVSFAGGASRFGLRGGGGGGG